MKRIYVAGLYSLNSIGEKADIIEIFQNVGRGKQVCADLFKRGYSPFCPWHDSSYVMDNFHDKTLTVEGFKAHSLAWLEVSDAMFVISGNGLGGGVDMEIEFCNKHDIPVFHFTHHMKNYFDKQLKKEQDEYRTNQIEKLSYVELIRLIYIIPVEELSKQYTDFEIAMIVDRFNFLGGQF